MPLLSKFQTTFRWDKWGCRLVEKILKVCSLRAGLPKPVLSASEVLNASPWFDKAWYLAQYPDVAQTAMDPVEHYLHHGAKEGRDPSPKFHTGFYLQRYPDVLETGINPLVHYILYGQKEGRGATDDSLRKETFDFAASKAWVEQLRGDPASARMLKASPRVSIILPSRNRVRLLPRAIESILLQTYRNWELWIIDDGSSDGTAEMVKRRFPDSRIHLLRTEGVGVCAARNLGLKEASGKFIAYLDSDNAWTPKYLELMLCELERSGAESAYAVLKIYECLPEGKAPIFYYFYRQEPFNYDELKLSNFIDMNIFVHRKYLLDRLGGFDVRLRRAVDWDLVLRYTRDHTASFANFVGALYDNSPAPDRISNTEALAWLDFVRNLHWIDWKSQIEALPSREPDRVSLVICVHDQVQRIEECLAALFSHELGEALEIILVDNGSPYPIHQRLRGWAARYCQSIRLIKTPLRFSYALVNNIGFAASSGARVVFLDDATEVTPEGLGALVGLLKNPKLKPHDCAALTDVCLTVRADDFALARGFDPTFTAG
jgi:glycosyltransferase involved in cell wall biosynthesis